MFSVIKSWYIRHFSNEDTASFFLMFFFIAAVLYFFAPVLMPVLIAMGLAYLFNPLANYLERKGLKRIWGVLLIMIFFIAIVLVIMMILIPLIFNQVIQFIKNIPDMLNYLNTLYKSITSENPEMFSAELFNSLLNSVRDTVAKTSNSILQFSITSLFSLLSLSVNAILVPIIMFFFLLDKDKICHFFMRFLPRKRKMVMTVLRELDTQMSNYIVGNALHILFLFSYTLIPFWLLGVNYALLLSVIIAVSVIIPYIGIIISTIPVILMGLYQWGLSAEFGYLIAVYILIQAVDGNITVPLLFSERLSMNPVVIIISVIIFGGVFGFWGIFFAIPLAALLKAIMNAWPVSEESSPKVIEKSEP